MLGFDQQSQKTISCEVLRTLKFVVNEIGCITTNGNTVFTTLYHWSVCLVLIYFTIVRYHPFLEIKKGWSAIRPHPYSNHQGLQPRDEILGLDGPIVVTDISITTPDTAEEVYTLAIQKTENFFANGLLVHNYSLNIPMKL